MRANKRVQVHNVRDFPQAKFDSEINADLNFLLHNLSVQIIFFKLKNKEKMFEAKKDS